jgi:hypothetical protein
MKKWTARAMGWVTHDLHGCRHIFHRRLLRSAATAPPPPPLMAMAATALLTAPLTPTQCCHHRPPRRWSGALGHAVMRTRHEKGFSEKKSVN